MLDTLKINVILSKTKPPSFNIEFVNENIDRYQKYFAAVKKHHFEGPQWNWTTAQKKKYKEIENDGVALCKFWEEMPYQLRNFPLDVIPKLKKYAEDAQVSKAFAEGATHYIVEVSNENADSISFDYWASLNSLANNEEPDPNDCLYAILSDATSYLSAGSLDDFQADFFGDSAKASEVLKVYNGCKDAAIKLKHLLGSEEAIYSLIDELQELGY